MKLYTAETRSSVELVGVIMQTHCDENALPPLVTHFSPSRDHATSFKTKIMADTNHPYNGTASKSISKLEKQTRIREEDVRRK